MRELSGAPGSHRASNSKNKQPLEGGKIPTTPKVKISEYYMIAGGSWLTEAPKHHKEVMEETVYAGKGFPSFVVLHDQLMKWENIGQENVTVLSHTDHFLTAASQLFEMLYDMAERSEEFDLAFIWNVVRQGICMTSVLALAYKIW